MNVILKKPLISEKSMKLAKEGLYTFLVDSDARKIEIAQEVKDRFGVDVLSVKTFNLKEQKKMQRGKRGYFMVSGAKKALVQVKKGQKIEIFETEAGESKESKEPEVKEKKSLLKGTKVKIEKKGEK